MKKVIFIGGTSFSGSTMLDMMLGNSHSSFSAGEVRGLFQPRRLGHINPPCGCGNNGCKLWSKILTAGKFNLYHELFKSFPGINTIIDSSKDPFWINEQRKNLQNKGIKTDVILIWKTPSEFAYSRLKRDKLLGWKRTWINYHRLLFSLIEGWRSIQYLELVRKPVSKLREICYLIDLPYVSEMQNYWQKTHHTIFGNTSAKFHMHDRGSMAYDNSVRQLNLLENEPKVSENRYRSLYCSTEIEKLLPKAVLNSASSNAFDEIISLLKLNDVGINFPVIGDSISPPKALFMPAIFISLYKAKMQLIQKLFYIRYRKRINTFSL